MISRRLLRIKVLQVLYAYYTNESKDLQTSEKELNFSINKSFELYNYLLLIILEIRNYAESRIEIGLNKKIPTYSDLNPNKRFVENSFMVQLSENEQLKKFVNNNHISWVNHPELIKELYNRLTESESYLTYMDSESCDYQMHKKIVSDFYSDILLPNELLQQVLEEQSIYWNDDLEYVVSMILKTIKRFSENDGKDKRLLELYKNKEDKDYVTDLFRKSVGLRSMCLEMIEKTANNWDLERIAFMDVIVMQLAITEFLEFPSIPSKVTLNEYLDIARYYSTDKSNTFINGVLDKILTQLRSENKIVKTGRGLIGEV